MKGNPSCHRYTEAGKENHDKIFNTCRKCHYYFDGECNIGFHSHETCGNFKRCKPYVGDPQ